MSKEPSLLSKIKSKYILQDILSLAFGDIKSVIKFTKYNKSLLNRIDINIKTIHKLYDYKLENKINSKYPKFLKIMLLNLQEVTTIILFIIYIILFYKKGKFNDEILKLGYNESKKQFIDSMDNYILIPYLIFLIASKILNILIFHYEKLVTKGITKFIILCSVCLIDISYYILILIKFVFSVNIINEDYLKELKTLKRKKLDKKTKKQLWFYDYDIAIIFMLSFILTKACLYILGMLCKKIKFFDNEKIIFLKKINGVNIMDYELPLTFDNFNEMEKIKFIYKKENIKKYKTKLNENQIDLIDKINNIRKINNIPILEFNIFNKLPNFVINEKTELFFYPNKHIYKFATLNLFIFKYPKNVFIKFIKKEETLNIITNYFLSKINIIEINNLEYIYIYNTNIIPLTITIKRHRIRINANPSDNESANTEDKF